MTRCVKIAFLTAALVAAVSIGARAETPEEEIRGAIARLGAEDPADREMAQGLLREIGPETVLLYNPADQGKDPEVVARMTVLLKEWDFLRVDEMGDVPRPARIVPWVQLSQVPASWIASIDDDRLGKFLFEDAITQKPVHPLSLFFRRDRIRTSHSQIKFLLSKFGSAGDWDRFLFEFSVHLDPNDEYADFVRHVSPSAPTPEFLSEQVRLGRGAEALMEVLKSDSDAILRVNPECLPNAPELDEYLSSIPKKDPRRIPLSQRWPCDTFTPEWISSGNVAMPVRRESPAATAALSELVTSKDMDVAWKARLALALRTEGGTFEDFDTPEGIGFLDDPNQPWGELFATKSAQLKFKRGPQRLRALADDPRNEPRVRAIALRALCALNRERDVTFVWSHLKELPPVHQPEVCVSLARIGSSAGIGLLTPLLRSPDFALRSAAVDALHRITSLQFDDDPAGTLQCRCRSARKWAAWWKENRTVFSPDRDKIR